MEFWNIHTEINFFQEALKSFASPEQLFYHLPQGYYAYVPKNSKSPGQTLQSRNSLIGQYTEHWSKNFLSPIAKKLGLYAVNGIICPEIGLDARSKGDLAFCTTNTIHQKPGNIKLLFEIKMSIVNNYKHENGEINFAGDFTTHRGNPSLLRSDSVLKAIGKSLNIRVSGSYSAGIPIIIIGNSPISGHYLNKVDYLKKAGIIQGFISLYPQPAGNFLSESPGKGFQTFGDYALLENYLTKTVESDARFFSSMLSKKNLGEIIRISARENNDVLRAEKFLSLIKQ